MHGRAYLFTASPQSSRLEIRPNFDPELEPRYICERSQMTQYGIGETVFVPRCKLGLPAEGNALYRTTIRDRKPAGRSIKVDLPGNVLSEWIATKNAHKNIGVYIVRMGDFDTEYQLLEPLTKSILQFFRLMFTDDTYVRLVAVRSCDELSRFWRKDHDGYSHVVLVGHGRADAVRVGIDGWVESEELADTFAIDSGGEKVFISLCCRSGCVDFARPFSSSPVCSALIAPYQKVHAAIASNLCQSYFTHHFLDGLGVKATYNRVRDHLPGGTRFRFWEDGRQAKTR
jgi:hypothetical protein